MLLLFDSFAVVVVFCVNRIEFFIVAVELSCFAFEFVFEFELRFVFLCFGIGFGLCERLSD